jgi:hypothetical protein
MSKLCFHEHHLTIEESGLLNVCLRLTVSGTKPLHFDGRTMGKRFSPPVCHQRIYRIAKQLETKGWLIKKSGGYRSRGLRGRYAHKVYTALTHENWIKMHSEKECRTVSCNEHGDDSTVITTRPTPSSPRDHSLVKDFCITGNPKNTASSLLQEQEGSLGEQVLAPSSLQDTVKPAAIITGHGEYTIPPFVEYDHGERRWTARRNLGRGTTSAEVEEIRQLNRKGIKPPSIQ